VTESDHVGTPSSEYRTNRWPFEVGPVRVSRSCQNLVSVSASQRERQQGFASQSCPVMCVVDQSMCFLPVFSRNSRFVLADCALAGLAGMHSATISRRICRGICSADRSNETLLLFTGDVEAQLMRVNRFMQRAVYLTWSQQGAHSSTSIANPRATTMLDLIARCAIRPTFR
jgi:hypothetical protein